MLMLRFQPILRQLTALALTSLVALPAVAQTNAQPADAVQAWVETFKRNHQFNGAVVVVNNGKAQTYVAGVARPDEGIMISASTPFHLAQTSRVFTAALILKLQELGKLKLEDEVSKYLPELSAYPGVTVNHLLTHTSGIPGYETLVAIHIDKFSPVTNKEVIALFKRSPLPAVFRAGERVQFSSADYALLATLAERVGGGDYSKLLQEHVIAPAGLKNTTVGAASAAPAQPLALRYVGGPEILATPNWMVVGGSQIYASINDLAAFDQALTSGKIVNATSAALFGQIAKTTQPNTMGAMAWTVSNGGKTAQLDGQDLGYRSLYRRQLDGKRSIIVLANTNNTKLNELTDGIAAILEGQRPVEPRISIAYTISQTMNQNGVQAAIQQYNALKSGTVAGG